MVSVLFVLGNNVMHGTERFVIDLARTLPKDRFDIYVAIPQTGPITDILNKYGLNQFIFDNGKLNKFSFKGMLKLSGFIRKKNIDIIHSNCGIFPSILGTLLFVKKTVETRHGLFYTDEKLKRLSLMRYIREYIKQYFLTHIVAISDNDKTKMHKYFGYKNSKMAVIYNGIDVDFLKKIKEPLKAVGSESLIESKTRFCSIGRLCFQKAQEVLLRSMKIVTKELSNIELVIIGEGENKKMLEQMLIDEELEKFVKIQNYRTDIYEHLKTYSFLVLTSRYEGVPYVVLEAMALGVPVICTDVGGLSNIIRNNENGLLIEAESPASAASAIVKLIEDKEFSSRIKATAYEMIEQYTLQKMVDNYAALYLD